MPEKDRKPARRKAAAKPAPPASRRTTAAAPAATGSPRPAAPAARPAPPSAASLAVKNASEAGPQPRVSQGDRARMIAEAAYYRAERRGFRNGDPVRDWVEAEAEIEAMLRNRR